MNKVISIYKAKTNFSKLIKKAKAGETIYVGAYGQPEAVISPLPTKKKINIGVWDHKRQKVDYEALAALDKEIATDFAASASRPL